MTGYMMAFVIGWVIAFLLISMPQLLRASGSGREAPAGTLRFDAKRLAVPAALALLVVFAADTLSDGGLRRLSEGPTGAIAAATIVIVLVFDVVMIRRRSQSTHI